VGDLAGSNGWLRGSDPESQAWTVDVISNASLHIMGSKSFLAMAPFWAASDLPFAAPMNQIPKAVFSRRGAAILRDVKAPADAKPGAESWAQAYVASGDLREEIAKLKAQDGKPIIAHAGATFARSLVAGGLVDQFMLAVHPVALGKGQALFSEIAAPLPLKLVSAKAFPGGTMAQVYRAG
jgi:dihydrofolate reductase